MAWKKGKLLEDSEEFFCTVDSHLAGFNMSPPSDGLIGDAKQAMSEGKSGLVETGITGLAATTPVCVHNSTWNRKIGKKIKTGKAWEHSSVSGRKVDVGGRGQFSNIYVLNLKVSFILVKTNSFHHTKIWSSKTW